MKQQEATNSKPILQKQNQNKPTGTTKQPKLSDQTTQQIENERIQTKIKS